MKKILLTLAALALANTAMALPFSDRITLPSGEKIFVSGFNLAWINFAGDVGDVALNESAYRSAMKAVADSGGNTMRVWLSTNGSKDPKFGADGLVSGLGSKTITNVQKMLAIAKENKMLLLPVLLTHNFMDSNAVKNGGSWENNRKLLTTDAGLQAYIDNAMLPLVKAIGNDPNLLAWEICNECEGMVEGVGWTPQRITKANVQKFTNKMTGAIKRAVPGVLVSTGTVQANYLNWYADAALKTAGADADGTMDFYMVHYYGWNGPSNSPFKKSANSWSLDKPIVVGEFASTSWSSQVKSSMQDAEKIDTLLENLLKNGYAGGLFWQYQQDGGDPWMKGFATAGTVTAKFARAHKDDVTFDGISDGKFSVVASASAGGSISVNPTGRVAAGSIVTLTATAMPGYDFVGWSGDTTASVATLKVTVNKDRNLMAVFKPNATTNLIKNGDFADGSANWGSLNVASGTGAAGTVNFTSGKAVVSISGAGTLGWHLQLSQSGIEFEKGATYTLSFDASASAPRTLGVDFSYGENKTDTALNWKWLGGGTASLTTTMQSHSVEVTPSVSAPSGVLQFGLGGSAEAIAIDNVTLVRKGGTSILPRTIGSSKLSLRLVAGGFEWVRTAPLAGAATVRVVDVQGHELYRSVAEAGVTTGFVPAVGAGLRFVVLESAQERDVRSLTSTR